MPITRFSEVTCESIGWYVYALADRDDQIFYVGKGTGNRVFDHVNGVRALMKADPSGLLRVNDSEVDADAEANSELGGILGDKRQRIAEFLLSGIEPRMYIVREQMSEPEALRVESVLISVLDWQFEGRLTNLIAGHGSEKVGLKTVDELEATKGEPFRLDALPGYADLVGREVVAININRRWPDVTRGESTLLEVSEGDWKLSMPRAEKCAYAIVHANNIVRGVFRVLSWRPLGAKPGRVAFVAENSRELYGEAFSNKNASSLFGPAGAGSQNPIRYVPVVRSGPAPRTRA